MTSLADEGSTSNKLQQSRRSKRDEGKVSWWQWLCLLRQSQKPVPVRPEAASIFMLNANADYIPEKKKEEDYDKGSLIEELSVCREEASMGRRQARVLGGAIAQTVDVTLCELLMAE